MTIFIIVNNYKMTKAKEKIVKSTREGKLYISTEDFLRQRKIQETIKLLLQSNLVKMIEKSKR